MNQLVAVTLSENEKCGYSRTYDSGKGMLEDD